VLLTFLSVAPPTLFFVVGALGFQNGRAYMMGRACFAVGILPVVTHLIITIDVRKKPGMGERVHFWLW